MKLILALMCGLVILFSGGCALLLFGFAAGSSTPGANTWAWLGLLPAAVAVLNLLIIIGLYGWGITWRPAFYILGIIDILIAAGSLLPTLTFNYGGLPTAYSLTYGAIFALKGVLTLKYAQELN
jgi:hypothetical protein